MASKEDDLAWLQQRTEEYRAGRFHTKEVVEDFDEVRKLGQVFVPLTSLRK
jgi:hypothetical protein